MFAYILALNIFVAASFFMAWRCYNKAGYYEKLYEFYRKEFSIEYEQKLMLENQLAGQELDKIVQQTRIFGNEKTETLIAEWLESQYEPFGNDLTDFENSTQIAARIRRGEYLDELVSSENKQEIRGDEG